jgi:UDP-N-acetylglucosamine 3-dehydrogenase
MAEGVLRVAIAGAGFMGSTHAPRWAAQPGVHVVGVYSRTRARAEAVAQPLGAWATDRLDALLSMDADVVDICLPTNQHCEVALQALAAGRHVVCEKPIALTPEEGERMAQAARRAGRLLLVAHVVRFWPEYARLREMVVRGELGRPTSAYAQRLQEGPGSLPPAEAAARRALNGGPVVDLQIHDDDFLAWLLGAPGEVAAWGSERHVFTATRHPETGAVAVAEAACDMPAGYPFTSAIRVRCEEGVAEYLFRAGGVRPDEAGGGVSSLVVHRPGRPAEPVAVPPADPYTAQIAHFAACLRVGEPSPVVSPESSIQALRIALAARDALDRGAAVRLSTTV